MNSADCTAIDIKTVNTEQLINLLDKGHGSMPLYWHWSKTEQPIVLHKMLRDLVGRRATFMADYQQQKSIVKLFYNKQGLRHARRETIGLEKLSDCGVATSQVLHCRVLKEGVLLVLSYLNHTEPLSVCWQTAPQKIKEELLLQLFAQLQRMYCRGVYQDDLHLDNILFDGKKIYIIDGMGIRHSRGTNALAMKTQLENLAELFLEFSFCDQALLWRVLEKSSFPFAQKNLQAKLQKRITEKSCYKQHKFQRKVWRNCTAFVMGRLSDYNYAVVRSDKTALVAMFGHLEQHKEYFKPLKQGRTSTVFHYQQAECNWVVKRYNIKSFWHGIMRSFRRTRAASSWQNANRLQLLHILTAKPIGILQKNWGSLRRQSYFVMEYVAGASLQQYLNECAEDVELYQQMIKQVVQVLSSLKQNCLCHGDLKADNWRVCDGKLYLLDLDSLQLYRDGLLFNWAFHRDLKRFLKNWQDTPVLQQYFVTAFKESKLV